ncbi:MAG: hypothetical protein K6E90_00955 [Lachnospiraceae bacterium]|nr:hypothetical protein [Lachnospiraceae bacterium]MCR5409527.1 hypothetical protein [Lachnospiraceae bacterium]
MRKGRSDSAKTAFTLIGFALVLVIFLIAVKSASGGNIERQQESLEKAIQRDVTYCYATTGRYPKTLDYIERVYGLTYDKELFTVEYEVQGSKIPPIVRVDRVEEE